MVAGIIASEGKAKFIAGAYLDALSPAPYQGDCSTSSHLSTAIHLIISILSTGLLMCSNFTMQCLSAPSREEVDAAHSRGRWLEVGTSGGIRNFQIMDWKRRILWFLLLITSTPIHLICNSAIFASIFTQDYGVIVVSNNYSENDSLVNDILPEDAFRDFVGYNASDIHNAMFNGSLETLTAIQCAERYAVDFNTAGGTVVAYMVADQNNSSLFGWICEPTGYCGDYFPEGNSLSWDFVIQTTFWVYPNRTFTLPNIEGQYQTFDSATLDYSLSQALNIEVPQQTIGDWVLDTLTFFK
ncbi:hypothetical protein N7520_004139 [Penicillium odoratum]|uniref:uncharacterized protein n=1 Tax=Penicillium odoratum TaxID=1167516 RepID=UPI002548186A|nr:uncharacterized protein N7520_004139 [Penicillium odoratum]KAJ5769580.1 hypothetical protein N7520_004139 [Penicillium odoratum]